MKDAFVEPGIVELALIKDLSRGSRTKASETIVVLDSLAGADTSR